MRLSDYDKMEMDKDIKELKSLLDEIFGNSDENDDEDDSFDYEEDYTPRRDEIDAYLDSVTEKYGKETIGFVVECGDILMKDPRVFAKVFDILIQSAITKGFCPDKGDAIDKLLRMCDVNNTVSSKNGKKKCGEECETYVSDRTYPCPNKTYRSEGTDYRAKTTC